MLLNPLVLPAFSMATTPHSFNLNRRDYSKFEPIYKSLLDQRSELPAPVLSTNKCWYTFTVPKVEACQREATLATKFFNKYFDDVWGAGATLEEINPDMLVRGSCMLQTGWPEIREAQDQCRDYFCPKGSKEREEVEVRHKKNQEITVKMCPELMDEWKDALERGFVWTTTVYPLATVLTVDGTETVVSGTETNELAIVTQRPFTFPESAWAFTTAFQKTTKTTKASQPERTEGPSKTGGAENNPEKTEDADKPEETKKSSTPADKPEETKKSSNPNSEKSKDADEPENAKDVDDPEVTKDAEGPESAAAGLALTGFFGIAISATMAWAVAGF